MIVLKSFNFKTLVATFKDDGKPEPKQGDMVFYNSSRGNEKPDGLASEVARREALRIWQEKMEAKADRLLEFARDWQQLCPSLYFPDNIELEEGQKDYLDGLREVVPLDGANWDTWASCALSEASWLSGDKLESVAPPRPWFTVSKEAAKRMKRECWWTSLGVRCGMRRHDTRWLCGCRWGNRLLRLLAEMLRPGTANGKDARGVLCLL